jgi:hypothetical protein
MAGLSNVATSRAVKWLKERELPYSDGLEIVESTSEFDGGGVYGVEIPAINTFDNLSLAVRLLKERDVYCTRFNETHGSHLLTDSELIEMLALCKEEGYGLVVGLGPRPEYDVKASFYRTKFGLEQGRQLNNNDAIAQSVEEAMRLSELGCTGFVVYDIGLLSILKRMRSEGAINAKMMFKTSSHCMASNSMISKNFADLGADSITTMHDLGLPVIAEMRKQNPDLVLDIPTDVYASKGGFIRFYELADFVAAGAPIFLKMGASVQGDPYDKIGSDLIRARISRVATGQEMLKRFKPDLPRITKASRHVCLPSL